MSPLTRLKMNSPHFLIVSFLSLVFLCSLSSPVLAAGSGQSLTQANWPMFGYNLKHTHYNPNETILSPTTVSKLTLAWSYQSSEPVLGPPTVVNGVVYIGSEDSYLYAFDASTGAILWKFQAQNVVQDAPAVVNGMVFTGTLGHWVYAFH